MSPLMQLMLIRRVYKLEKKLLTSTIDKTHLNGEVTDGSVANGIRKPILFSYISYKPPGFKVFGELETIQ